MKILSYSILALILSLAPTGCGLTKAFRTGGDALILEFADIAEAAVSAGTVADLAVHPEHRVLFQTSQAGLSNFIAGAGTSADTLYNTLATLQPLIPALRDLKGNAVILAGVVKIFNAVTGWEATIDGSLAVQTIGRAILRGLDTGLAATQSDVRTVKPATASVPAPLIPTRRIYL